MSVLVELAYFTIEWIPIVVLNALIERGRGEEPMGRRFSWLLSYGAVCSWLALAHQYF